MAETILDESGVSILEENTLPVLANVSIQRMIIGKTNQEIQDIKSIEIAKIECSGIYVSSQYGCTIEIMGIVNALTINGKSGVEVFARAWKNGNVVGFGDGTVEIERFRVFNPPILVSDTNGTIVINGTDIDGNTTQRFFREDPLEAIRQVISHNVNLVGLDGTNVIPGKIGTTTDTFFPSDDAGINPTDNATWATVHDATTGSLSNADSYAYARLFDAVYGVDRYLANIDTSTIGTDTITSAVYSVYSDGKGDADSRSFNVYSSTHSVPIVAGDFDLVGTTAYATAITDTNWNAAGYNDFTLLTPDDGKINKTGTTKLCIRDVSKDVGNVAPVNTKNAYVHILTVATSGTSQDPKLVIVHSAAGGGATFLPHRMLMGIG